MVRTGLLVLAALLLAGCVAAPRTTLAQPIALEIDSGPALPEHPTQADEGAQLYWQICMACHGNRGQGLTDEWREQWGPEEMNCWQSKCHAANHPPQGFQFPHQVPAVFGPNTLMRYRTAQDLHEAIADRMPWWSPKSLSDDEVWALTAYLLRARGALRADVTLDAVDAMALPVNLPAAERGQERPEALVVVGLLTVATLALVIRSRVRA